MAGRPRPSHGLGSAIGGRDFISTLCRRSSLRATSESGCYRSSVSTTYHHPHIGAGIQGHSISRPVPTGRGERVGEQNHGSWDGGGTDAHPGVFYPWSRVHWGGETRNCWSAPAGSVTAWVWDGMFRSPQGSRKRQQQQPPKEAVVLVCRPWIVDCAHCASRTEGDLFSGGFWIALAGSF